MKKLIRFFGVGLVLLIIGSIFNSNLAAQGTQSSKKQGKTVYNVIQSNDQTTHFAKLLKASGYSRVLNKKKGPYTVLAPSNKALQSSGYDKAKSDPAKAKKIVNGQLYKGNVSPDQVKSNMGVKIIDTDKTADNGTVYIVDKVIQRGSSSSKQ